MSTATPVLPRRAVAELVGMHRNIAVLFFTKVCTLIAAH